MIRKKTSRFQRWLHGHNVCSSDSHTQRTFMTKRQHEEKQENSGTVYLDDLYDV